MFLFFIACSVDTTGVQAIGDSIFDWNDKQSIPHVVGEKLNLPVVNNAIGGSKVIGDDGIPLQYEEGDWQWVLIDGGGNDLNEGCGCTDNEVCNDIIDSIVAEDGSEGLIYDVVERIIADGHNVALLGYYEVSVDSEFGNCNDELYILRQRYTNLASLFETAIFVDPTTVVRPDMTEAYDDDLVHPSIEGGRIVGELIAESIENSGF